MAVRIDIFPYAGQMRLILPQECLQHFLVFHQAQLVLIFTGLFAFDTKPLNTPIHSASLNTGIFTL